MKTKNKEIFKLGSALVIALIGVVMAGNAAFRSTGQTAALADIWNFFFPSTQVPAEVVQVSTAGCFVVADVLEKKSGEQVSYTVESAVNSCEDLTHLTFGNEYVEDFPLQLSIKDSGNAVLKKYSYVSSRLFVIDPAPGATTTEDFGMQEAEEGTLRVIFPVLANAASVDLVDASGTTALAIPKNILQGTSIPRLSITKISPKDVWYRGQPFSLEWNYSANSSASPVSLALIKEGNVVEYLALATTEKTISEKLPYRIPEGTYSLRLAMDNEQASSVETLPFLIKNSASALSVKDFIVDASAASTPLAKFTLQNSSAAAIEEIYFSVADATSPLKVFGGVYTNVEPNAVKQISIPLALPANVTPGMQMNFSLSMSGMLLATDSADLPLTAITATNVTVDPVPLEYTLGATTTLRFDATNSSDSIARNIKFSIVGAGGEIGEVITDIPAKSSKSVSMILKSEGRISFSQKEETFQIVMYGQTLLTQKVTYTKVQLPPTITSGTFTLSTAGIIFKGTSLGTSPYLVRILQGTSVAAKFNPVPAYGSFAVLVPCSVVPGSYAATVHAGTNASTTPLYTLPFIIPATGLPTCAPPPPPVLPPPAPPVITKATLNTATGILIFEGTNLATTTYTIRVVDLKSFATPLVNVFATAANNKLTISVPCTLKPSTSHAAFAYVGTSASLAYQYFFTTPGSGLCNLLPVITSVSPMSFTAPSANLVINGTGFGPSSRVTIQSVYSSDVYNLLSVSTNAAGTQITGTTPSLPAGSYALQAVNNQSGAASALYLGLTVTPAAVPAYTPPAYTPSSTYYPAYSPSSTPSPSASAEPTPTPTAMPSPTAEFSPEETPTPSPSSEALLPHKKSIIASVVEAITRALLGHN